MLTLWTAQTKRVLDTLQNEGIYFVKMDYVQEKYQESAWIFKEAYEFFVRCAADVMEKPEEAQSMVWLFADPMWAAPDQNTYRIMMEIPEEEVLLFDRRKWNRILNLSYVGGAEEEKAFDESLAKQGIQSSGDVFSTPFYPALRSKIRKSWDTLFDGREVGQQYVQGASWCLKREWIRSVEPEIDANIS